MEERRARGVTRYNMRINRFENYKQSTFNFSTFNLFPLIPKHRVYSPQHPCPFDNSERYGL